MDKFSIFSLKYDKQQQHWNELCTLVQPHWKRTTPFSNLYNKPAISHKNSDFFILHSRKNCSWLLVLPTGNILFVEVIGISVCGLAYISNLGFSIFFKNQFLCHLKTELKLCLKCPTSLWQETLMGLLWNSALLS